ncbi:hypothetical protein DUNSADRAFT_16383 [Dunaliella salina]|uniref:Encoded protein n=1 Tax=Dunaliella salina TaxID=3046 RepID=A0ABQ7G3N4_DUNSA|nr:hypothetical protein DUNSADRAFT_16383 [Dunaliella salina]|eukprot:KAF5829225.1 hypothetical protein DUNSADRAFT_16383 [Dunaliella salina]
MERRQRRQIKTPKRFEDAEVYWDLSLREPEQTRSVYRLLKRKDIRPGLRNKEVQDHNLCVQAKSFAAAFCPRQLSSPVVPHHEF